MLVLTRGKGQKLLLDGDIEVEILDVVNGVVQLGITAPPDVEIWRTEIAPRRQKQDASRSGEAW